MRYVCIIFSATIVTLAANANNLRIANLNIKGRNKYTAIVKFDISWENSWRRGIDSDSLYFHDAAGFSSR